VTPQALQAQILSLEGIQASEAVVALTAQPDARFDVEFPKVAAADSALVAARKLPHWGQSVAAELTRCSHSMQSAKGIHHLMHIWQSALIFQRLGSTKKCTPPTLIDPEGSHVEEPSFRSPLLVSCCRNIAACSV
jgi:hypothetical protein